MEFVISQGVLKEELGYVQGIVERKATIPVLSNILIESVGENTVRFVGTDLDVTIRCEAEAEIREPGSMCVQARKLFDIVRLLPDADVHFKGEDNDWVRLKCEKSNFRLAGVSRDQFPEIPDFTTAPLSMPSEVFNNFVLNTSFAITNEQSRFTLSGAKFVLENGKAKMVTTDAHRLAFIEKEVPSLTEASMDSLIPKKALTELVRISKSTGGDINFGEDANHIYFELEGHLLISRKLSGTFPNYEMVMPKDNDKVVIFDLEGMKRAVARIALMADERTRSIRLTIREGEVEITAQSSEEGDGKEIVAADYSGDEVQVGFNAQYLLEFLTNVSAVRSEVTETETDGDKVKVREGGAEAKIRFEFKDGNAQTQMSLDGETDYDYKYVVMPLRI